MGRKRETKKRERKYFETYQIHAWRYSSKLKFNEVRE